MTAFLLDASHYAFILTLVISLCACVPRSPTPILTRVGSNSLPIFLFHTCFWPYLQPACSRLMRAVQGLMYNPAFYQHSSCEPPFNRSGHLFLRCYVEEQCDADPHRQTCLCNETLGTYIAELFICVAVMYLVARACEGIWSCAKWAWDRVDWLVIDSLGLRAVQLWETSRRARSRDVDEDSDLMPLLGYSDGVDQSVGRGPAAPASKKPHDRATLSRRLELLGVITLVWCLWDPNFKHCLALAVGRKDPTYACERARGHTRTFTGGLVAPPPPPPFGHPL
eukprot:4024649-Prymnesium_polylepis.2